MNILAIMGLRGGSTGLADKNIRKLNGSPLFTWSLSAAKYSNYVNRIIISTDSLVYQNMVTKLGIESPYLRPCNLATASSPEIDFIRDLLEKLKRNESYIPDICVRLLATVPMQLSDDIDRSVDALIQQPAVNSSVVISESRQHPNKSLAISHDGKRCFPYGSTTQNAQLVTPIDRNQYPKSFHRSNIITFRPENIFETNSLTGNTCFPIVIDQRRSIDIDAEVDLWCADAIMSRLNWSSLQKNAYA